MSAAKDWNWPKAFAWVGIFLCLASCSVGVTYFEYRAAQEGLVLHHHHDDGGTDEGQ